MSGVVIDIGRLKRRGSRDELEHQDCVMLESWQARELVEALDALRSKASPTSYPFIDLLRDAIREAANV